MAAGERNRFNPALGRFLWLRYVLEGELASHDVPRVFVRYDDLLDHWPAQIDCLQDVLKLRLPRSGPDARDTVADFLSPTLRHFHGPEDSGTAAALPWMEDVLESWSGSQWG